MYEKFYGFSEEPFNFGPDSKFICLAPRRRIRLLTNRESNAYSGIVEEAVEELLLPTNGTKRRTPGELLHVSVAPEEGILALKKAAKRTLFFRPVYRLAAGSLLLFAALGFFILSMSDHSPVERNTLGLYPPKETAGNSESAAIGKELPAMLLPAERSDPAPVPNITIDREAVPHVVAKQAESLQRAPGSKREVPQPSAHKKPEEPPQRVIVEDQRETVVSASHTVEESPARPQAEADADLISLKQDAAWLMLNR